jgi:WD40 repeat protein
MPEKSIKIEMDKVEDILNQFSELNSSEKSRFLRKLVKKTSTKNPSEMNFLRSLVMAVPVGSNLDKLPSEVFTKVLSNLDSRTLGRLAVTCKKLSGVILSEQRPWKTIFDNENFSGRISEVTKMFQAQICQSIQNSASKFVISPYSSSLPYTAAFFYESRLQRNWSKVNPGERPVGFDCHGSHVVTCMEIDPKGCFILTGSDDGTVRLWSANIVNEPRELCVFTGHLGGVWALKVDWERGILVTGSTDRTLIIWDLISGERLKHLLGHTSTVRCVELVNDLIVSGSRDGTLRVWSLATGECLHLLQGHTASVRCLALGPEEGTIVSGSYDHTCRLWNLTTGDCLKVFEGHSNKVYAVTSTEFQVFSGSLDGTVRVWDIESGECVKKFEGHRSLVGLVQAKDHLMRNVVITGSTDGSLQIIKKVSESEGEGEGEELYETAILPSAHPSSITSLDFNRNFLVTGSEGVVRLWSLESGRPEPCLLANLIENLDMVWRVAVNDNLAVIAYQVQGLTRLAIFNFAPQPQQVLIEMRAFKNSNPNFNTNLNNNLNNNNEIKQQQQQQRQQSQSRPLNRTIQHQQESQMSHQHNLQHQRFFMSIETPTTTAAAAGAGATTTTTITTITENFDPLCNYPVDVTMTDAHPELLVLGMASQSLVEHADDLIYTE